MKLVIEIPEEDYNNIEPFLNGETIKGGFNLFKALEIIKNGKPLPKGHGDLITKEQAIEIIEFYQINPQHFDFVNLIEEIKDEYPVIEAESEE